MSIITELKIENVKRIKAVQIKPDGTKAVIVAGNNGQGKTSILDSIEYLFAGARSLPSHPLRSGQTAGSITATITPPENSQVFDNLTITRTFEGGKSQLKITAADGYEAGSPQGILDSLCNKISFDPLEFTRLKPKEQVNRLRELVGLDFTELDAERKRIYDERTDVNRDGLKLKAKFDGMPRFLEAPAEEISVAELSEEQKRREAQNRENAKMRRQADELAAELATKKRQVDALDEEIARLMAAKEEAEKAIAPLQESLSAKQAVVKLLVDEDVETIRRQIVEACDTNDKVRANAERKATEAELTKLREQSEERTKAIKAIDDKKAKLLAEAKWPVPGLGFSDNEVTFGGIPFNQASAAEQLTISVAMGAAMNAGLKVMLIRDGSLLDPKTLALLTGMAEKIGVQLFIERVGTEGPCSVIIEDGMVKSAEEESKTEPEAVAAT